MMLASISYWYCVLFLSFFATIHGEKAALQLKWIDSKIDSAAVCNDGSKTGFHFAPAIDANFKDTYLIFLPGGGQCFDYDSCSSRWKDMNNYMSSKTYESIFEGSGIFDTDPTISPLWGANKVRLGYCSSDGYMGNIGASEKTWGWHFRGARIVITLIKDLIANYGLSEKSTIIMAGASAGGRGVMTLLDLLVRDYFPKGSRVIGFLDSPYYLDIPPFAQTFEGFPFQEQSKYQFFNTSMVLYDDCLHTYGSNDGIELWKCQFGQYRMPFVHTPYLLIASQYDAYQLGNNIQQNPPYDSNAQTDYALNFATLTKSYLQGIPSLQPTVPTAISTSSDQTASEPGVMKKESIFAYLSWACYDHAVSEFDGFSRTQTASGMSQSKALATYMALDPFLIVGAPKEVHRDRHVRTLYWMDECEGFACGPGCA